MSKKKNIFTGETREERHTVPPADRRESIAKILARAEALNPLSHLSGRSGFLGLGAGRRTGPLCSRRIRRERARRGEMFGIKDAKR